ncbi:MAG: cytochrome c [Bdellovibrio sp.]
MSQPTEDPRRYNHGGMIAFSFSMFFCFAFFFYIVVLHPGIDLKEGLSSPKPQAQVQLAQVDVSKISEPWVANADMVLHGQKLFSQNCAMCHGNEGRGDGAAGAGLNPKPRNLVEGPWKKGGGFIGLYTVLTEGIAGGSMASYKHLKPVDRWALVQFIDSITQAKIKEDAAKLATFAKSAQ